LTVGKYLTPNGIDIDWKGIAPDFTSAPSPDAEGEAIDACRIRSAS
jgi:C-terminal processing protease CtpA/Prc